MVPMGVIFFISGLAETNPSALRHAPRPRASWWPATPSSTARRAYMLFTWPRLEHRPDERADGGAGVPGGGWQAPVDSRLRPCARPDTGAEPLRPVLAASKRRFFHLLHERHGPLASCLATAYDQLMRWAGRCSCRPRWGWPWPWVVRLAVSDARGGDGMRVALVMLFALAWRPCETAANEGGRRRPMTPLRKAPRRLRRPGRDLRAQGRRGFPVHPGLRVQEEVTMFQRTRTGDEGRGADGLRRARSALA